MTRRRTKRPHRARAPARPATPAQEPKAPEPEIDGAERERQHILKMCWTGIEGGGAGRF